MYLCGVQQPVRILLELTLEAGQFKQTSTRAEALASLIESTILRFVLYEDADSLQKVLALLYRLHTFELDRDELGSIFLTVSYGDLVMMA